MLYSTPNTRSIEWGHSVMTFLDRKDIVAVIAFPDGPQGPIDNPKSKWLAVRESWIEDAMLPQGAYFPRGLSRGTYSQTFILEVR